MHFFCSSKFINLVVERLHLYKAIWRGLLITDDDVPENIDILFFCHDDDRGEKLTGRHYATILDSFRERCELYGYKCATIAHPWSVATGNSSFGNPVSVNRAFFRAGLLKKIYCFFAFKSADTFLVNFYQRLLRLSGTRLVISIGSPEPLAIACRSSFIRHAELLHAMGYSTLEWGWDAKPASSLPQYILSMDATSTMTFGRLEKFGIKVFEIPHPYLSKFTDRESIAKLPEEWKTEIKINANKKRVLVCLQWGYAGELGQYDGVLPNGLFPCELETVIRKTTKSVDWCFRLHPTQLQNPRYQKHIDLLESLARECDNVFWKNWSSMPLPTILGNVSGCLSMSSFAAYDAAYFEIPSILMCPTIQTGGEAEFWFADLVEQGYVKKITFDTDVIMEWVDNLKPKKRSRNFTQDKFNWSKFLHNLITKN